MSERVDLCHSVMYALFFECPLFLFADLQINVVVGRCRTLSFDLGILCLSGFLAFKGRPRIVFTCLSPTKGSFSRLCCDVSKSN
jgi:hypothetical protein